MTVIKTNIYHCLFSVLYSASSWKNMGKCKRFIRSVLDDNLEISDSRLTSERMVLDFLHWEISMYACSIAENISLFPLNIFIFALVLQQTCVFRYGEQRMLLFTRSHSHGRTGVLPASYCSLTRIHTYQRTRTSQSILSFSSSVHARPKWWKCR